MPNMVIFGPDPPKIRNFDCFLYHEWHIINTLQMSPQPLSGVNFPKILNLFREWRAKLRFIPLGEGGEGGGIYASHVVKLAK